jgi:hypothetical protein
MSMDEFLNKKITIKQGLEAGIITSRVLSDFNIWERVNSVVDEKDIPKTHAAEIVAEKCRISERQVWYSYSFTAKLIAVE